ncbi:hypothetical protein D3C81_1242850 [compost metagenome]
MPEIKRIAILIWKVSKAFRNVPFFSIEDNPPLSRLTDLKPESTIAGYIADRIVVNSTAIASWAIVSELKIYPLRSSLNHFWRIFPVRAKVTKLRIAALKVRINTSSTNCLTIAQRELPNIFFRASSLSR